MEQFLQDLSPAALARAIEENAVEGIKSWAAWPSMEVHQGPGLVWTLTSVPFPIFNNALGTRLTPEQVDPAIDAALVRAKSRNVPMAWWLGPTTTPTDLGKYLEDKGFVHGDDLLGMAVDLVGINEDLITPPGLSIAEVNDADTLRVWCQISSEIFELPDFAVEGWSGIFSSVPFGPGKAWRHYLASLDGVPVATSSVFFGAGVAGISSVATVPEARRRGIGSAITVEPLKEARRLGYRVATLFSSEMAVSLYQKLGFQEYCRGGVYVWMDE